jgi:DNA (cytosine-5)-methyltransferase 1
MSKNKKSIKFIDLFAGIGGIRMGFEQAHADFECVYSNEYNNSAASTYRANFGDNIDTRDIREVPVEDIPAHDILCAGFPCQPFSVAGVSARSGLKRPHGFKDKKQGNLFFEILRIVDYHKPTVIFLENVANFERHNKGNTIKRVRNELRRRGYKFNSKVIDASLRVPQRRKRIYMIATLNDMFEFKDLEPVRHTLGEILETHPDEKYTISDLLWSSHQARTERNRLKGNGFKHNIVDVKGVANTLTSRYGKDGRENLVMQQGKNPRMLTPRECARLMGFKDTFILPATKTPAYRQMGNSVCVPIIEELASQVHGHITGCTSMNKAMVYEPAESLASPVVASQAVPLVG